VYTENSVRIDYVRLTSAAMIALLCFFLTLFASPFCARVWSVRRLQRLPLCCFPLFVSPDWKRLGFERYFEMQAGNFMALAGYYMVICGVFAFGAHFLRRTIGIVVRRSRRRLTKDKV